MADEEQFTVTVADGRTRTESLIHSVPGTLVLPNRHEQLIFTVFPSLSMTLFWTNLASRRIILQLTTAHMKFKSVLVDLGVPAWNLAVL